MYLYNVGSHVFAASYYCPFTLIRGPTRVSVWVYNIAVDPRVLGVLQVVDEKCAFSLCYFDLLGKVSSDGLHILYFE